MSARRRVRASWASQSPCPSYGAIVPIMRSRQPAAVAASVAAWAARPPVASFIAARAVVLAALVIARWRVPHARASLLAWDAAWYHSIAEHGYGGVPAEGIRFFPLLPLMSRVLGGSACGTGVALLLIANTAALAYAVLAQRVAALERMHHAADRVPWAIALAPAGFVLVMGYTEALFGVAVCLVFLGARSGNWRLAIAGGIVGGLLRPTGAVLCVPILIEVCRRARSGRPLARERALMAVAVVAPLLGLAAYAGWCWAAVGDPFAPFRAQTAGTLRGGVAVDPLATAASAARALATGDPSRAAPLLHLAWVAAAAGLLWLCARRLPCSYTWFAAATVALALTARGFTSFERYGASALPLLLVAAQFISARRRRAITCAVAVLSLALYSFLAFAGDYTP
jgi:hypothetical protein